MKQMDMALLSKHFEYDAGTGKLTRLQGRYMGREAGYLGRDGYRYVQFQGQNWLTHRMVWALFYGEWPSHQIDHKNMQRNDNRISNLRPASLAENNRNRTKQSNNTTGFKGVTFHKASGKYHAKISLNKVCTSLGHFHNPEEAAASYAAAAGKLHGVFARTEAQK